MNDLGKASAYIALFAEVGLSLFVTTLGGALLGGWIDQRLGTAPLVGLVGFLTGMVMGAVADGVFIARFLKKLNDQQ
jgi:F0F1-type ATP synthase assembly protein I